MSWRRHLTALAAIAVLAGCAEQAGSPDAGHTGRSSSPAPETLSSVPVPEIWRFTAPLVGGGTLEGADLAGDKVAVWLWAPW